MKKHEFKMRFYWENTDVGSESKKAKSYIEEKYDAVNVDMKAIFDEFFACKSSGTTADSAEAQALVAKLQAHITESYYTCTDEVLAGLGKMYGADEQCKKNIEKSGEGTAEFAADAIATYTKKI